MAVVVYTFTYSRRERGARAAGYSSVAPPRSLARPLDVRILYVLAKRACMRVYVAS